MLVFAWHLHEDHNYHPCKKHSWSDACSHSKELAKWCWVYIHRQLQWPTALLHIKNNDLPRDATPRAGRLTLCSAKLYNSRTARAVLLLVVGVGFAKTAIFSIGWMCFHHQPAVYFYSLSGDVVMRASKGGRSSSASVQPLKTQGAVWGAEPV